ncbi:hypothetical protein KEM52_000504 [Ascosphaera acerosa]|nr:hypothetical protein KEM52_000504 [Ascosphaera acerosa]
MTASTTTDPPEAQSQPQPQPQKQKQPICPLDSPLRTTPIHPSLAEIKVPSPETPSREGPASDLVVYNPLTCEPYTEAERHALQTDLGLDLDRLAKKHTTPHSLQQAIDDAAKKARELIDDVQARWEAVEKEMMRKREERHVERRVFEKVMEERKGKKREVKEGEEKKEREVASVDGPVGEGVNGDVDADGDRRM